MELFIAEKPSVGKAIAAAIGATESKNGYMEGHGFMVTWCLGHLVELAMPEDYNKGFATWRYKDLPIIPDKWQYNVSKEGRADLPLSLQKGRLPEAGSALMDFLHGRNCDP